MGKGRGPGDRRRRPALQGNDEPAHRHGRRPRAGVSRRAVLQDMEFMQFHPTVLYIAGSARYLLTEALRGEGAYLRDSEGGRFMLEAHPLAELAPETTSRGPSSRRMEATRHPCVYLDMKHLDPPMVKARFPGIDQLLRSFDLDLTSDLIPVRPGAALYDWRGSDRSERAPRLCQAFGPRERRRGRGSMAPTGWPRTASWRGWSMALGRLPTWPNTFCKALAVDWKSRRSSPPGLLAPTRFWTWATSETR